jgi:hypothetical protein
MTRILLACGALLLFVPAPARALAILPSYTGLSSAEEALIDDSFAFWEATILDSFDVSIAIEKVALSGDTLAHALDFVASADGRPASARIEIDDRVGDFGGWFLDPSPSDSSEFVLEHGRLVADAAGPAASMYDLLTVMHHELGHVLGFTVNYPAFAAHVVTDASGHRRYQSAALDVPLSSHGTHLPGALFPFALMSETMVLAERRSASAIDVLLLADAFGYSVVLPPPPPDEVPEPAVGALLLAAVAYRYSRNRRRRLVSQHTKDTN